ncbi:DUF237 domain-containing protein [Mycoplasmoides pneumoniae]
MQAFKEYWQKQKKDVTDKKQLLEALKLSFAKEQNKTFAFLIKNFQDGISNYYPNDQEDQSEAAKTAFGTQGIAFPQSGLKGIFMSEWLRKQLGEKAKINLDIKSLKVTDSKISPTIKWNKDIGIKRNQDKPYNFRFEIDIEYQGNYKLSWLEAIMAKFSGIPGEWKGKLNLKFIVDGDLSWEIVQKPDYPGSLFQFDDQKQQLLFKLHVWEKITVQEPEFMELIKSQNLHNLELRTESTKPPVVDLASYLHYQLLKLNQQ